MTKQVNISDKSQLERADSYCQIDFLNLFDNNQFDVLTDNYNLKSIGNLTRSIPDEKLRNYVLNGIQYERKIKSLIEKNENFDEYIQTLQQCNDLQAECRNHYLTSQNAQKYTETSITLTPEEKKKCFTAQQQAIFSYYNAQANKVYFNGQEKNCDQTTAKKALEKIFGKSQVSYNGHIVPKFDNENTRRDMQYVMDTIMPLYPNTAQLIKTELINLEEEYEKQ